MTAQPALPQRLLTPGPTAVPPPVLKAMALPIIHHRTKQFQGIFKEVSEGLQKLFKTTGPVLSIAGSGTTAFEASQIGLARPGSKAITVAGGKFGERWQDIYDTYHKYLGVDQIKINTHWGDPAPVDQIEQSLKDNPDVSIVTVVHSETSTATTSDVKAIAALTRQTDALLLVDGITAVGALEVEQDAWGIDVLVTGSQKAMMLPPGLGYVGLGERALKRLEEVEPGPQYNLDLRKWVKSWQKNDVPFTPPVPLIRGQKVALDLIFANTIQGTIERTRKLAEGTRAALTAIGIKLISSSPSNSVTGVYYPDGVDDTKFRGALRDNHGIHIAGGQDGRGAKWKGKVFRLSHMGFVGVEDTRAALAAIEVELNAAGYSVKSGAAVDAFDAVWG
jgi:serine---pyruvate transaminase